MIALKMEGKDLSEKTAYQMVRAALESVRDDVRAIYGSSAKPKGAPDNWQDECVVRAARAWVLVCAWVLVRPDWPGRPLIHPHPLPPGVSFFDEILSKSYPVRGRGWGQNPPATPAPAGLGGIR